MIKNIIFDLGNVLLDLDLKGCMDAFVKLGATDIQNKIKATGSNGIFGKLEHGQISELEFYDGLRDLIRPDLSDAQLRDAWNTIITDFPKHRVEMLLSLHKHYKLYVLSNTSAIHATCFEQMFKDYAGIEMSEVFEMIFYSQDLGLSKPNPEIYKRVIEESGLNPSETVFIDDAIANTTEALKHGFHIIESPEEDEVADYDFNNIENNAKFVSAVKNN